jgi:hypothetical protein
MADPVKTTWHPLQKLHAETGKTSSQRATDGIGQAVAALNAELKKIENLSMKGLWAIGLRIIADAVKGVPVEFGNLRASGYVRAGSKLERPDAAKLNPKENLPDPTDKMPDLAVELGFTASYAVYVHENTEQRLKGEPRPSGLGTYWNPGGPKFLLDAVAKGARDVATWVARHAKIK